VTRQWAEALRHEIDSPDLWGILAEARALPAAAAAESTETAFTREEKERLTSAVSEIHQRFLSVRDFSPEEKDYLDREFAFLREAIDRQGKKQWLHTAAGVVVSAIVNLGLSDRAADLWRYASQQIGLALQWALEATSKLLT